MTHMPEIYCTDSVQKRLTQFRIGASLDCLESDWGTKKKGAEAPFPDTSKGE